MHRFYVSHISGQSLEITQPSEIHHIKNVLRLKPATSIHVFDGKGCEALATIQTISDERVLCAVTTMTKNTHHLPYCILACAIPKKSKFETIIEKTTELGIDEIIPLQTKRTEVHLNEDRLIKKAHRYQTVAVNAAKQCKRSYLPVIREMSSLKDTLLRLKEDTVLFIPSLEEKHTRLMDAFQKHKSPKRIALFIGPEGDFTKEEYALARKEGCIPVSLGNTILKVETAAISSVAAALFHFRP